MLLTLLAQAPMPTVEMTGYQFWLLVIPMVFTGITAIVTLVLTYGQNGKLKAQEIKLDQTSTTTQKTQAAVQEVHILFNSRFSALLDLTAKSSHAEGVADATKSMAAAAVLAADPTGSIAGLAAHDERALDATAAREIRAADFVQAHANAQARAETAGPVPIPGPVPVPGPVATLEIQATLHPAQVEPVAPPAPPA